jgi:hypothetical protein
VAEKLRRFASRRKAKFGINNFSEMTGQQQLAFILYLIQIFPSLNLDSITLLFKRIGSKYKQSRIATLLSILVSANHIHRVGYDKSLFVANRKFSPLLEIEGVTENGLLAEHLEYFQKYATPFIPT